MRTEFLIQMEWPNGIGYPLPRSRPQRGTHWETVMETRGCDWKKELDLFRVSQPDSKFRAIRREIMPYEVMG